MGPFIMSYSVFDMQYEFYVDYTSYISKIADKVVNNWCHLRRLVLLYAMYEIIVQSVDQPFFSWLKHHEKSWLIVLGPVSI